MNSVTGGSRFRGVSPVEFFDEATSRDVREGFPSVVRFRVTFPFNQILEPVFDAAGVSDILDFKVFVVVLDVGGGRCRGETVWGKWQRFDGVQK